MAELSSGMKMTYLSMEGWGKKQCSDLTGYNPLNGVSIRQGRAVVFWVVSYESA